MKYIILLGISFSTLFLFRLLGPGWGLVALFTFYKNSYGGFIIVVYVFILDAILSWKSEEETPFDGPSYETFK